ncbi:testican-3 isoform X1 [Hemicordylus capensis]|uniref:testican-3 isoform X1 n=2 Tax=Hemicordylus capensis TaxID=884348 RepID=UPI0023038907|nr:testican-3 isoform X1 [Hemicordylus capensis]
MLKVAAFVCVWAAAWCSQAVVAAAAAAAAAATGAGGRSDSGNFLDDKQWLTTISQYDKEVGQWNKFRDVDYALLEISVLVAAKNVNRDMEVRNAITISMDDYFRTWSPARPFDQALDPAKDPCLKMKCSRHKVCVAQDQQTAVCISHRRLTHSMKEAGLGHKQWRVGPISSKCKQCPAVYTSPVCGSDGHAYSSQCKLEYQACVSGKQISVKCEGRCPCPSYKSTSIGRTDKRVCSDLEFREVANRLRDWFKALHESGIQKRTRTVQRPERSRFDTSILPICKDSLGWMFNRLDTNYDLLLDQSELGSIYLDKNEQCTKAFFNSCDTYKDSLISNNEWCYCFQRQQDPPCQTELSNIQKQQGGKKLLGQYIPLCDEDGYYKPTQCHGSAGQCWCVDRYGNEVTGSRTHGAADCVIDLETSGDFASGDFHEWTDDEDDDMMNDEDEIEDDDEDEGDDDDDDDHEGYI